MPNLTLAECQSCVGPGWESLIEEIYNILPADAYITQVKEKFGTLRFYVYGVSMKVSTKIQEVELRSGDVCEQCGEPGELRNFDGWYMTRCDKCAGTRKFDIGNTTACKP